jgi:hypothetical protein
MSIALRDHFLAWQCRLRQAAMRQDGGRPSRGMRPRVTQEDGTQIAPAVTVLIMKNDPADSVDLLRHTVRRTHDPKKRYEDGLKILSAEFYEDPRDFSDVMTGLFPAASATAAALLTAADCVLYFQSPSQGFQIACATLELTEDEPFYQLTYWHNRLFNTSPPTEIRILAFHPDWTRSSVD